MLTFLHTNDFHGKLTPKGAELLAARERHLYFDSGDCIRTGNLGIPLRPEPAWGLLARAGCDASVLGNRESHPVAGAFLKKLEGHAHPVLVANLRAKQGDSPVERFRFFELEGKRIGVFGVMVAMVTEKMATQAASAYLWDPPLAVAAEMAAMMRPECDVLVALTHIGFAQDRKLAEMDLGIDVIFGGHSHTVLETPVQVGKTWIAQGGSHGRFLGVYQWDGALKGGLEPFSAP